jgi:hypothetical protein
MNKSALSSKGYRLTGQYYDPNLSFTDRQIRYIGGIALIAVPLLVAPETLGLWSVMVLSSIPLIATAIMGWDPLYALVGRTTYAEGEEQIQQRRWTCPNIGIIDRVVRFGLGAGLIMTLFGMSTMSAEMAITLLAIPLIATAIIAWDPIYAAMNVNSFASRIDVDAAEPESGEQAIATCYTFPTQQKKMGYPRAA